MQPIHSNEHLIYKAANWTVEELLVHDSGLSTYVNFNENETFALYQEPVIGWMTPQADKLGYRANTIIFRYTNPGVKLLACEGKHPVTLTAIKVAVVVAKILSAHMTPDFDYPCAQPLSPSDWNFLIIGGRIESDKLRECRIDQLCEEISPLNSDFAVGLEYFPEKWDGPGKLFSVGDLVVVRRSEGPPTFAKVIEIGSKNLKVAIKLNAEGQTVSFKPVPRDSVLCHWAANALPEKTVLKKRKI